MPISIIMGDREHGRIQSLGEKKNRVREGETGQDVGEDVKPDQPRVS